jgi:hypothetical protein
MKSIKRKVLVVWCALAGLVLPFTRVARATCTATARDCSFATCSCDDTAGCTCQCNSSDNCVTCTKTCTQYVDTHIICCC